jgi:hypothetical protein
MVCVVVDVDKRVVWPEISFLGLVRIELVVSHQWS